MLLALLVPTVLSKVMLRGTCNSYEQEKLNEGCKECVYKDSRGIPTIGVGFNLSKPGATTDIENVGADYGKVINGSECLTDSQIEQLFNKDMDTAVSCVSGWISNWSSIGETRQSAVADMSFNLGCGKIKDFHKMKSDIEAKEFSAAAKEMQNSTWCSQVGQRCAHDMECME